MVRNSSSDPTRTSTGTEGSTAPLTAEPTRSSFRRTPSCLTDRLPSRRRRGGRRARELLTLVLVCACLPATAQASPSVSVRATLTPEHLGHGTTIGFDIQITAPSGRVPPPLTGADVRYPNNLGIALSGVGIETCSAEVLQA